MENNPIHGSGRTSTLLIVILALAGFTASAQEITATNLDTAKASAFVGEWTLNMVMGDTPVEVQLTVKDVNGKLGAMVVVPQMPNAIVAGEILRTPEGIDLSFPVEFGGQTMNLTLALVHKVAGTLSDDMGMFSADVEGVKVAGGAVPTEPLKASNLDTSSMGSYIGAWDLAMNVGGRDLSVTLEFLDVDGKVGALFLSPFNPEPEKISEISLSEEGTRLAFDASMRGQSVPTEIWITRASETLEGTFSAMGGALKADFLGTRTDKDLVAKLAGVNASTSSKSRGGGTRQAKTAISGNEIKVRYTAMKGESTSFETLANLKDGEIFSYTDGRTIKLFSDADIVFGDTTLKTENAADDYPGVYSLWLKRSGDGWSLVANSHADILGSQHDPAADVAEFPVSMSSSNEETYPLAIEIEEAGNGGVLKIAWGNSVWSAPFQLGENTIAKQQ
jgi:hypothetical protein